MPGMQTLHAFTLTVVSSALALASAIVQFGAPPPGGDHGGMRGRGPSPQAKAACDGKSIGASASFTGRSGRLILATCQRDDGVLAAWPVTKPARFAAATLSN